MKKNNKGFTLIELLVVVAIIGILAAVGTVAYTGYTKSAKKNASGSNHATVVKYIAAELAKCNLESEAFKTSGVDDAGAATDVTMNCDNKKDDTATSATAALSDFKNPYKPTEDAVSTGDGAATPSAKDGNTVVSQSETEVTISTQVADGEIKTNKVSIE